MKTITGGCACGAIRYEVTAEPIVTFNCHCRDCQKTTGGATDFGQGIAAGTLDDPSLYKPQHEIWTSDAQPWDAMDPKLPKFEKYAPRE